MEKKKSSQDLTRDPRDSFGLSFDPSAVSGSLIRNGPSSVKANLDRKTYTGTLSVMD